jgi:hypothetical protein
MDRAWTVHGLSHAGYGQSHHPPLERRLQALTSSVRDRDSFGFHCPEKRAAEHPQPTDRESRGSPTLQPLQDPVVEGGFPNPNEEEPAESSRATLTITRLGLGLLG